MFAASVIVFAPVTVHADVTANTAVVLSAEEQAALDAAAAQALALQQASLQALLDQQVAAATAAAQAAAAQAEAAQAAAIVTAAGMTYIDINIDAQTLTYFVNGVPFISTSCVTGGPGNGTPRGFYTILNKVPGKYLKGPTWNVWVDRWMRFTGNVGIHDASWRRKFGGNIYKSNGSHGCVNIPFAAADQLYNTAPVGTVVYVH
ncbi:MAG: L,D-transpeptidase [Lachnospiraceae bacterium]|nr:L,D-transpeptidase [Lachnospiraceae bacterium]